MTDAVAIAIAAASGALLTEVIRIVAARIGSKKEVVDEHATIRADLQKMLTAERDARAADVKRLTEEINTLRGEQREWEKVRREMVQREIDLLKQITEYQREVLEKDATIVRMEWRIAELEKELKELRERLGDQ